MCSCSEEHRAGFLATLCEQPRGTAGWPLGLYGSHCTPEREDFWGNTGRGTVTSSTMAEGGKIGDVTSQHPKSEKGAWQRPRGGSADGGLQ